MESSYSITTPEVLEMKLFQGAVQLSEPNFYA